jgi:flagellar biogenesis protein FliO
MKPGTLLFTIGSAWLAIAAVPPAPSATSTASNEEQAQEAAERKEASCCANLQREFSKSYSPSDITTARSERKCCELIEREYEKATTDSNDKSKNAPASVHERSLVGALVQMVLVLGAICLLAYLVLGKMLPKLLRIEPPTAQKRILTVVDRLPVDQRRSIVVLKIGGLYFLVGITEQGISLISRLDGDDVEHALEDAEIPKPTLSRIAGVLVGRSQKES